MRISAQTDARVAYACRKLAQCGFALQDAKEQRMKTIHFARAIGMSNQLIGEFLGISEAAVRSLARRHKEDGEG